VLWLWAFVLVSCGRPVRDEHVLTVLALTEPMHLDPRFPEDALGAALSRWVYRGLLESDPRTFLPRLALAQQLQRVDDTHLRVTLRSDARFHDGTAVTSDDVVATYTALLDPAKGSRLRSTYARVIAAITTVDAHTTLFTLQRPDGTIESLLQQPIVPASVARGGELRAEVGQEGAFVGSGLLRVRTLARAQWEFERITPVSNAPSRVRVLSLHDPNTLAQRLLYGDGDVAEIKPELFDVFESNPAFEIRSAPSAGFTYLGINNTSSKLGDRRVRAALAYAIDRDRLREGKLGRHAVASTGPLPPTHWAYEGNVVRYPYDPAHARVLLDEAGLTDPPGATPRARWVMRVSSQRFATTVAHALAAMLADVGIEVEVRPSELATLLSDLRMGRFDLTFLTVPDLSDPWGLAFWFASTSIPTATNPGAGGNRWRFRNAELDALLEAGARAMGPEARRPHYQRAQQILAEHLPVVPLWHADVVFAATRRYQGLVPRGDGQLDFVLDLRRR
jgi:peptide/nickel transport system substrate-binding protein